VCHLPSEWCKRDVGAPVTASMMLSITCDGITLRINGWCAVFFSPLSVYCNRTEMYTQYRLKEAANLGGALLTAKPGWLGGPQTQSASSCCSSQLLYVWCALPLFFPLCHRQSYCISVCIHRPPKN
jgi:hypothetical protein